MTPAVPVPLVDPTPTVPLPDATRVRWLQRYSRVVLGIDVLALTVAGVVAVLVRFGAADSQLRGVSYYSVALVLGVTWLAVLSLSRCYEPRFLGSGTEEFRRVTNASARVYALVASLAFAFQLEVARLFVAIVLPGGLALLLLGRFAARVGLHRLRRQGRCLHRVVVLGNTQQVTAFAARCTASRCPDCGWWAPACPGTCPPPPTRSTPRSLWSHHSRR